MIQNRVLAALAVACVVGGVVAGAPAGAEEAVDAQIAALQQSPAKYNDVYAAVRDGYFSTVGCVHYSGETIEGHMTYAEGAMGVHFLNPAYIGPTPDPERPPILLYEPDGDTMHLVGAEWFVLLAIANERPTLFGQAYQGPMEGHEPLLPREVAHYDLHA